MFELNVLLSLGPGYLKYLKYCALLTGFSVCFSLEEDFVSWREQFWPAVCEHFGVEALGDESRLIHPFITNSCLIEPTSYNCVVFASCKVDFDDRQTFIFF